MEFISAFEVPAVARPVLAAMVAPEEVLLISGLSAREFDAADAAAALERLTNEAWGAERTATLLRRAYARGVIDLGDETFQHFIVGTFYERLGVLVVSEPEVYRAFPAELRVQLDQWYLAAYAERLGDEERPTQDAVLDLEHTLAHIDATSEQIWLLPCDCRVLAGRCRMPTQTCVSYRNGINTLAHRGWGTPLTKGEAKAVVRAADESGLMHTANPRGICNCCSECCYLFRAQELRGSGPAAWPLAEQIAAFDPDACIDCGRCVERCPFSAFTDTGAGVAFDERLCRGCALCANTCPTAAIQMRRR